MLYTKYSGILLTECFIEGTITQEEERGMKFFIIITSRIFAIAGRLHNADNTEIFCFNKKRFGT